MSKKTLRLLNAFEHKCYTQALSQSIQASPKCGIDFDFELAETITDPDVFYIDVVDEVYERPWNIYCLNKNDEPRDMCFKLMSWFPEIYCIDYSNIP